MLAETNLLSDFDKQFDAIDTEPRLPARTGKPLLRLTDDETAIRQRDAAIAVANFDYNVLGVELMPTISTPIAANDNESGFKEVESWPLLEQLNRTTFEKDAGKREAYKATIHRIRSLVDAAEADVLGEAIHRPGKPPTPDYDQQRTEDGKVFLELGQSIVCRYGKNGPKVGEIITSRHKIQVRKFDKLPPISDGFDVYRDDLFSERRIDAQNQLADLAAVVGPIWPMLRSAVCDKVGFTEISNQYGYPQPVVASAFIKLALTVSTKHFSELDKASDFREYVSQRGIPVAARRYERAMKAA